MHAIRYQGRRKVTIYLLSIKRRILELQNYLQIVLIPLITLDLNFSEISRFMRLIVQRINKRGLSGWIYSSKR